MALWKKGNTEKYNLWRKDYRKKMKENNRCVRCYKPLIEDKDRAKCINCYEEAYRNELLLKELRRGTY